MYEYLKNELLNITDEEEIITILKPYFSKASYDDELWNALFELVADYAQKGYAKVKVHGYHNLLASKYDADIIEELVKHYISWRDYDNALVTFERFETFDIDNPRKILLAEILKGKEDNQKAIKILQTIIKEEPIMHQAYKELADLYHDIGENDKAKFYYEIILEYFSDKYDEREIKIRLSAYNLDKDVISLEGLDAYGIDMDELNEEELYLNAQIYFQKEDYQSAVHTLEEIIKINPDSIQAYELLVETALHMGDKKLMKSAVLWLYKVLAPDEASVQNLVRLVVEQDLLDEDLIEDFKNSVYFVEDQLELVNALTAIVDYYLANNNVEAVEELLEEFSKIIGERDYLSYLDARLALYMNDTNNALELFETAYDYNIIPVEGINIYIEFLISEEKFQTAIDIIEKDRQLTEDEKKAYLDIIEQKQGRK